MTTLLSVWPQELMGGTDLRSIVGDFNKRSTVKHFYEALSRKKVGEEFVKFPGQSGTCRGLWFSWFDIATPLFTTSTFLYRPLNSNVHINPYYPRFQPLASLAFGLTPLSPQPLDFPPMLSLVAVSLTHIRRKAWSMVPRYRRS